MAALGALTISIEADMARFQSDMTKSAYITEQSMKRMAAGSDMVRTAMASMAGGVASTAVGMIGFSQAVEGMRAAIDRMDKLDEMAERLSINTQTLQEFGYAGKLTGVDLDGMGTAIKKLQVSMFEANTGGKESAAVFKALGISITDANGNLRKTPDVMADIADVFSKLEDGATKNALAIKIFGKAGADMVPFLSSGSKGIKDLTDEANKLGAVMGGDVLKAAAEFNDNMDRLATVSQAAANSLTAKMLPALNDVISRYIEGRKAGLGFMEALGSTAQMTLARATGESYGQMLAKLNKDIEKTQGLVDAKKKDPTGILSFFSPDKDLATLQQQKAAIQAMQRNVALAGSENGAYEDQNDRRGKPESMDGVVAQYLRDEEARKKAAADAQRHAKEAERNMLAAAKKQYEGRVQTIQQALDAEQAELKFANQYANELRSQDLISAQSYYDSKRKFIEDNLEAVKRAADKEVAVMKEARDKAAKPQDKDDYQNKINAQEALKAKAIEDAARAGKMAKLEEGQAASDLRKTMEDWARQQDQNLKLMQDDVDMMGLSQVEIAKLTMARRMQLEVEEQIRAKGEKGTISEDDIAKYKKQADDAIAQAKAKIDAGDAKAKDPYFNMQQSIKRYGEEAANVGQQIGDAMTNAFHGAEEAFVRFTMTGKLSFGDLAQSIIADMARMQAKAAVNGIAKYLGQAAMAYFGGDTATRAHEMARLAGQAGTEIAGARAEGGPVWAGASFLVGEKGPEIFTPPGTGTIVPNSALGGGKDFKIVVNNYGEEKAQTRPLADGNGVEVFINALKNSIGEDIAYGTGPVAGALQSRYGLRATV